MLDTMFVTELTNTAMVQRKISRADSLPDDIEYILQSIDYFNSFGEFHHILDDVQKTPFNQIPILNEFKDFILPRTIRFEPSNRRTRDLLVRPEIPDGFKFDINLYHQAIDDFRRHFKKDAHSEITMLDVLKKDMSLLEVIPRMYVTTEEGERFVKSATDAMIPINISDDLDNLFMPVYFDCDYNTCVFNYIHNMSF